MPATATQAPSPMHVTPPEVLAHEEVVERSAARHAEQVLAGPEQPPEVEKVHYTPPVVAPSSEPPKIWTAVPRRTREPDFEELIGHKVPWLKHRMAGGSVLDGLYIVNELGKEAFVPNRLSHLIPKDVMAQIPKAGSGAFVIDQPPNSLFAPPEDGIIVPHRLVDRLYRQDGGPVATEDIASPGPVTA